jgi:hypothetical protein
VSRTTLGALESRTTKTRNSPLGVLRSLYTPLEAGGILIVLLLICVFCAAIERRTAFRAPNPPMTDLEVYLRSAWAVRTGGDIYQVSDQNDWHYVYPPPVAIAFFPLAAPPPGSADWSGRYLPLGASVAIWYFLSVACVIFAVQALASAVERRSRIIVFPPKPPDEKRQYWTLRLLPVIVALPAIMTSLNRGQMESLTLLLLAMCILAATRGRQWRAGLWLGAAICIKLLPALLILYPLWRRQWRFVAGCAAAVVIGLLIVPSLVFGPLRTAGYYREYAQVMVLPSLGWGGDDSRMNELLRLNGGDGESIMTSLHNVMYSQLPRDQRPQEPNAAVRGLSVVIGIGLLSATLWAAGRARRDSGIPATLFFGLLILDLLLITPKSHSHYYCLIVPLVMGIVAAEWKRYGLPHIGWPALAVFAIYFCIDFAARLGQFDYALRDLGIPTLAALMFWMLGMARLARLRPRFARAQAPLDLPPDMILAISHE